MSATDLSYFKFRIRINFFQYFVAIFLAGIGKMVISNVTSFWGPLIWILPRAPNFEYPPLRMLRQFYDLREEVIHFLKMKGQPVHKMENESWLFDLAFLVDITTQLNNFKTKLQQKAGLQMTYMST